MDSFGELWPVDTFFRGYFLSMGDFELSCFGDGLFREHMTSLDLTVKTTGD